MQLLRPQGVSVKSQVMTCELRICTFLQLVDFASVMVFVIVQLPQQSI